MKKLIYFSPIAYDDLKQRPQYLAEGLSKFYDVVYVEPTKRLVSNIVRGDVNCGAKEEKINEHLTVVRCNGSFIPPFSFSTRDVLKLGVKLQRLQLEKYVKDADYLILGFEGWAEVAFSWKDKKVIYDKIDDTEKLINNANSAEYIRRGRLMLEQKADAFMVTAKIFHNNIAKQRVDSSILYLPNGVNIDEIDISNISFESNREKNNTRIYGYVGTVSEWFDFDAVRVIAKQPNSKVIIVGPCLIDVPQIENVEYVDRVSKKEALEYIKRFDVCIYPFKQNELLDTINPVKLYEYLALNRPVLAVATPEMDVFGKKVTQYDNYDKIEKVCHSVFVLPFDNKEELTEFIRNNSWTNRVDLIHNFLEEL